jgi:hypothetical protein
LCSEFPSSVQRRAVGGVASSLHLRLRGIQLSLARFSFLHANPLHLRLILASSHWTPALPLHVVLTGGQVVGVRHSLRLICDGPSLSKFNPIQVRQGQTTWSRQRRQDHGPGGSCAHPHRSRPRPDGDGVFLHGRIWYLALMT